MAAKRGFNRGTTFTGPLRTKFKLEGQAREFEDEIMSWNPRCFVDRLWDFTGNPETFDVYVQATTDSGVEEQATTGANTGYVEIPLCGRLTTVQVSGEDALAANDTNYITFTLVNTLGSGSGTTAMIAATDANTTKATGGTGLTAVVGRSLTVNATAANLNVAAGDVIKFVSTPTGTLANVVDKLTVRLRFVRIRNDGLVASITRTAGSPLAGPVDSTRNGEAILQFSATNEVNTVVLSFGDNVQIPATCAPIFSARVKISGAAAATRFIFGLASAHNATLDSVVSNAWFRIEGNDLSLLCESDDGTTDSDDQDSGVDAVADTYVMLSVDLSNLGKIRFWVDDNMVKELSAPLLTVSSLLQPYIAIQKDSGTGAQTCTVDWVRARWSRF